MKTNMNKRWILFSAVVMVMVMATAGMAISGAKSQFGGFSPFGDKGMHKERILSKLDYTMQELKLDSKQQAEYSAIRERMVKNMNEAQARRQATRDMVRNEMSKEQPDVKMLADTLKKESRSMPDMRVAQIDSLLEIYGILHKDQQAQFVKMVKKRMERMDHHRGGPQGRMDRNPS